jgi:hypothetical protein
VCGTVRTSLQYPQLWFMCYRVRQSALRCCVCAYLLLNTQRGRCMVYGVVAFCAVQHDNAVAQLPVMERMNSAVYDGVLLC